jgi:hypothetical protein
MTIRRTLLSALLVLAVLPLPLLADQPARGRVVATGVDYLVVDTTTHGRRLFVLDATQHAPPTGANVAVTFRVGDGGQLHARDLTLEEASATVPSAEPSPVVGSLALLVQASPVAALLALATR